MVLDDLAPGTPEERHLHAAFAAHVGNQGLQNRVDHGHKIRQALAARDANYQLAGLIEMDDTYFGAPKPGKRRRGAAGQAKVVVAVETPADKPRFAALRLVPRVSREEIQALVQERLATEAVIKTDGWQGYSFLDAAPGLRHE